MRVCLTMIMKNEAHVLARSLTSARPLVDCWTILDTGSTDDSIACAERHMRDIPGAVVRQEHPWEGFGQARTEAFRVAERMHGLTGDDYHLVLDADDELVFDSRVGIGPVKSDVCCYKFKVQLEGRTLFYRDHLFVADGRFSYRMPVHEYPVYGGISLQSIKETVTYTIRGGGARSLSPDKYKNDVIALRSYLSHCNAASENFRDKPRAQFYLAQSLRDFGDDHAAAYEYRKRAVMQGWIQEAYVAALECGRALNRIGGDPSLPSPRECFEFAHLLCPFRPEAAQELCLLAGSWSESFEAFVWAQIAARPLTKQQVTESLYLEQNRAVYTEALRHEATEKLRARMHFASGVAT